MSRLTTPSSLRRGMLLALAAADLVQAQSVPPRGAAPRAEEDAAATTRRLLGEAKPQAGRVFINLPEIAESGNSVPLKIRAESPMTPSDHVRLIHVVAERNPRPWVASFTLGARAGKAEVEAYIRLSDTQSVAAYAQMSDGSWWMQRVNVVVTIGACESLGVRY
ncbi:MAG TPA: thiosulfate oxidation carrier protein SoxY [Ramlibacter sp.]|nr:thiosulfate oxidation carrier protein SoxY [Ramlibacter sp.]